MMKLIKIIVPVFLLSSTALADVMEGIEDRGPLDHPGPAATTASLRGGALRGNRKLQGLMSDYANFEYRGTQDYCGVLRNKYFKQTTDEGNPNPDYDLGHVRWQCKSESEMWDGSTIADYCRATCYVASSLGEKNNLVFGWRSDYCGYLRYRLNHGEKQAVEWACLPSIWKYTGDGEVGDHCAFTCYAAGWKPTNWRPDLTLPYNWWP